MTVVKTVEMEQFCIFFMMLIILPTAHAFLDAITVGLASLFVCRFKECCNDQWIQPNLKELQLDLTSRVYGQHLVIDNLVHIMQSHLTNANPAKPLVLSFNGPTGSGKTFVSTLIAKNFFVKGMKSQFVHIIHATLDLPVHKKIEDHKRLLTDLIKLKGSLCERSIIIIEEVHLIPPGVLDAIVPFLDYNQHIEGQDYRKFIFIFLSQTGENRIMKTTQAAKTRESISLTDVQYQIQYDNTERGGLAGSNIIKKNLIDFYLPFLPMDRKHVELCIKDALRENDIFSTDLVKVVMANIHFDEEWDGLYATTGCRAVRKALGLILLENHHRPLHPPPEMKLIL